MKKSKMTRSKKAIFAGFLSAAMVAQSVSAFAAEAGGEYLPDLQTQNQEVVSETAGKVPLLQKQHRKKPLHRKQQYRQRKILLQHRKRLWRKRLLQMQKLQQMMA